MFINLVNGPRLLTPKKQMLTLLAIVFMALGCTTTQQKEDQERQRESLAALGSQLKSLQANLAATQASLKNLQSEQQAAQHSLLTELETISTEVANIPEAAAAVCAMTTASVESQCNNNPVQTIVMSDDKMVLGELEQVWIEPPGSFLIARVDTGANSSSLHATNLVEFERDGDSWVRFELFLNEETMVLERPVRRHVRVYQQADREGTRRPVVGMRIRLGDVQETFEFTLADRSHLDQQMLLGRNFLANMALVDVGKQFVQPRYQPQSN